VWTVGLIWFLAKTSQPNPDDTDHVLIWVFVTKDGTTATHSQEFGSRRACVTAMNALTEPLKIYDDTVHVYTQCARKDL
jgi:hypothetical protein